MRGRLATVALVLAGLAAPALAAKDPREATARKFFAAGKYEAAIDVYAEMYKDKPHANFLFNIGRCYQNLDEPARAIASFREFLRRAEHVAPKDKERALAFIREMEAQKAEREQAERALPPAAEEPPAAARAERADLVPAFLARQRAAGEAGWKKHAVPLDATRLATLDRTERLLAHAKADDPRRADYQLYLANIYAGACYDARLRARAARAAALGGEGDGEGEGDPRAASDRTAQTLEGEANQAFVKAVERYVAAARAPAFVKADEALYRLGVLLAAHGMEPRAREVLAKLARGFPASTWTAALASTP
jgi:tetratricopeptide (TPR) repeat protein